ncbi:hypothetical protein HanPSC8_Chr08g0312291 [Helianthus annuus]|nr:hypothetical protein HanPSC8_Chr08g0312291 [Helianthus annuus]
MESVRFIENFIFKVHSEYSCHYCEYGCQKSSRRQEQLELNQLILDITLIFGVINILLELW